MGKINCAAERMTVEDYSAISGIEPLRVRILGGRNELPGGYMDGDAVVVFAVETKRLRDALAGAIEDANLRRRIAREQQAIIDERQRQEQEAAERRYNERIARERREHEANRQSIVTSGAGRFA